MWWFYIVRNCLRDFITQVNYWKERRFGASCCIKAKRERFASCCTINENHLQDKRLKMVRIVSIWMNRKQLHIPLFIFHSYDYLSSLIASLVLWRSRISGLWVCECLKSERIWGAGYTGVRADLSLLHWFLFWLLNSCLLIFGLSSNRESITNYRGSTSGLA